MSDPSIKIKYFSLKVLKLFFPSFLGVLVFFGVITTIIYQIDKPNELRFIKENEQLRTSKLTEMINIHLNFVFTDLLILGQSDLLKYYINEFKNDDKEALARTFLVYSQERKIFDQIRLLSENGKELMRVNYNNGNPYIVPESKLQEKGERYYFRDTYQLNRGQIYMSPLDLNIEFGQLELPQKPIIRFGLPVFNDSGEKKGVLILNYLAQDFIIHFEHGRLFSSSGRNMLLNSNGYWLYNEEKENCWGFMNKNKLDLTFGNTFPDAWKQIDNNRAGKLVNDKGLFTFNTIYPLVEGVKSSSGAIEAYTPS